MPRKKGVFWESTETIFSKAGEKLASLKDPRYSALLMVEFFLTLILVGGILLYLDGRFNTIEPPFNFLVFAGLAYAVLHFYRYTEVFRRSRSDAIRRNSSFKTFALEFIIFLIVVFSAYIFYNSDIDTLPYPFNIFLFVIILSIPLYFYIDEKFLRAQAVA